MSDEKKKLAQRIVKLFNLGNSSSNSSEAEVESAVTKARQLMMEHALSMEDLHVLGGTDAKDVVVKLSHASCYTLKQKFAVYDDMIGNAVGFITDTRSYWTVKWENGQRYWQRKFLGDEGDVAVAGELFLVLLDSMRKQARAKYGPGWTAKHSNYCKGFAYRLQQRAKDFEPEPDLPVADRDRFALIVVKKKTAIDDWVEKNLVVKQIKLKSSKEFREGQIDGQRMHLTDPRRTMK